VLFGHPTLGFRQVDAHRKLVESAELVRTLYVAMTRAEDRLVVVGNWPEDLPGSEPDRSRTYLDLLRHRRDLPGSPGKLLGDCIKGGGCFLDSGFERWRFPALDEPAGGGDSRGTSEPTTGQNSILKAKEDSRALSELSIAAGHRMRRPFQSFMSADAGERLERALRTETESDPADGRRQGARAIGELVHRLFETWDKDEDPEAEWQRQSRIVLAELGPLVPEDERPAVVERATALLERIGRGELLQRFIALGESFLGREIPVLLAPPDDGAGPVGFYSGAIDLLYRHPETGLPVIVDFKTDRVESGDELAARAEAYAPQEDLYAEAIRVALRLESRPDTELWFLWPDRRWTRT
jgi:ATP-dependent exoDNAse (exonuclease V) beta subunit